MKDKNLNILSPRTSNPPFYIIYNLHNNPIVFIWTVNIIKTFIVSTQFSSNHKASWSSFK